MPRTIRTRIVSLAFRGYGVGRMPDGRVLLAPLTAPGDLVEIEPVRERKRLVFGRLVSVVEPSPERVEPRCPVFGRCGGCSWQHVSRAAQLKARQEIVAHAFRRLVAAGAGPGPIIAGSAEYGYRRRASFHFDLRPGGPGMGWYGERSHDIVDTTCCPVCVPAIESALPAIRAALPGAAGRIELTAGDDGRLVAAVRAPASPGAPRTMAEALVASGAGGAFVECGRGAAWQAGDTHVRIEGPAPMRVPACAFLQTNAEVNCLLVEHVVGLARAFAPVGGRVLELFAGSGNFTLPLAAAGFGVAAVESDGEAAAALQDTGPARVTVRPGRARDAVAAAVAAREPFDLVLLDPPRTGAREVMDVVLRLSPPAVVYVSCDPFTLARDAAALASGGYAVVSVTPLDMFPQTWHVETVSVMTRGHC